MKLPRKLKKKLKKAATRLYVKPNLKKLRILKYNKQTTEFQYIFINVW